MTERKADFLDGLSRNRTRMFISISVRACPNTHFKFCNTWHPFLVCSIPFHLGIKYWNKCFDLPHRFTVFRWKNLTTSAAKILYYICSPTRYTKCFNECVYSSRMLARHVSDLTGPSSGAFCKLYSQIWHVVIGVLLDTSSRYEVTSGKVRNMSS